MLDIRSTSKETSNDTWEWAAFLVDEGSGDLSKVDYVEYTLHETFPEPVRRVDDPKEGFRIEAEIKRNFVLKASVHFKDGAMQRLTHRVQVRKSGESLYEVREDELIYIQQRRRLLDPKSEKSRDEVSRELVGLALSGGGIRSATTNLGVLQALSRMGILPKVDYLCTVSGGGYIGGCLSALLSIKARDYVENKDQPWSPDQHVMNGPGDALFATQWKNFPFRDELGKWPDSGRPQVKQLRTHGNFLVARKGFFTTETLRSIGGVLTGIAFNWTLFLLAFAFIAALGLYVTLDFLAPGAADLLKSAEPGSGAAAATTLSSTTVPGAGESAPPSSSITFTVQPSSPTLRQRITAKIEPLDPAAREFLTKLEFDQWARSNPFVQGAALGAGLALAAFIIVWLAIVSGASRWGKPQEGESREDGFQRRLVKRLRWLAGLGIIATVATIHPIKSASASGPFLGLFLPLAVTAGFWIAGFALYVLLPWGEIFKGRHLWSREFRSSWGSVQALATYWVVGAAALVLYPSLVYALWDVGIFALVPALVSALASRGLVTRLGSVPGVSTWIPPRFKNVLLGLLVGVFIVLMVLTLAAWFVDWDQPNFWNIGIVSLAVACLVGIIGNSNKIGLHYFYRDRLIETYLRTEATNRELTLDLVHDSMDMRLKELHGVPPVEPPQKDPEYDVCVSTAPYLLVSAAINIAERSDLTRKDRKSGYFVFSKLYCGSYHTNFRRTDEYQGGNVKLARAMTISGAAVGSGMGYQTFFAQAFVTTLFNLRLGYWMENPGKPLRVLRKWAERPIFSPWYLLKEMFSWTHARGRLVNLSDGGHTGDNVGIYPLLQRRCQVIIACDAEADPQLAFGSFTEALRHAYVDMNIDVDIDLTMIRPDPATGRSQSHCAVGRIKYPDEEPGELPPPREAWLIYLKNSLTGDEPEPVKNYKVAQSDFPHETTVDQFFDDAQFESYRALGDHLAEHTFAPALGQGDPLSEKGLRYLQSHHSSFKAADDPDYRGANQRLAQVESLLTEDKELRWYYEECYSSAGRTATPPQDLPPNLSRVFLQQARLMEYVFITLDLGRHGNAPDNRGWMNLFRSWGRSATFRAEFEKLKGTFNKEFEDFYDAYIKNRDQIDKERIPHPWDQKKPADVTGVFLDPGRREARAP